MPAKSKLSIRDRFWNFVDRSGDCWIWTGFRNKKGYGHFNFARGGAMTAHRFAYLDTFGEFDRSLQVCHKCDNPPCVNPNHLFLGTNSDNQIDSSKKGRHCRPRGEKSTTAKLTWEDVEEIRHHWKYQKSQKAIGKQFGVSQSSIWRILHNLTWIE